VSLKVYLNGRIMPEEEAKIPICDRGFLYGDGVFETMRAYGGFVFRAARHVERLLRSLGALGITGLNAAELEAAVGRLLEENSLKDAYIRVTVSRGAGYGPGIAGSFEPTVAVCARPLEPPPPEHYTAGVGAIVSTLRQNADSPANRFKSLNYLENILAKEQARLSGAVEAIRLSTAGWVVEGATSNLFIVSGGSILTPSEGEGILPGITRSAVMETLAEAGLSVLEGPINENELRGASEIFLTNSILEVVPVTRLDGAPVGGGAPGPVAGQALALYRRKIEQEKSRHELKRTGFLA